MAGTSRAGLTLTAYVTVVIGLGLWGLMAAGRAGPPSMVTAAWFLSCLLGESLWFRTPTLRGTISLALPVDLAALVILPPRDALLIIGASTFLASLFPHGRGPVRALFNAAQSIMAGQVALAVLRLGEPGPGEVRVFNFGTTWGALYLAGLTFFLVNSLLVAGAISLSGRTRFWRAWRMNFGYWFELATTMAQISLAGFLVMANGQVGPLVVLAMLPVLAVLWWSCRREADRRNDQHREPHGASDGGKAPPPDRRQAA